MATIISFANQKGGVGKTTLCTTFANFLVEKGERLLVLDCDSQQSISEKRKVDEHKYPNTQFGYNVQSFNIGAADNVSKLMHHLKEKEGIILVDTPGHLSQQGLLPIFVNSDFIVCPYQYEATSISSTITFLKFFKELKVRVSNMVTDLLLVVNCYDKRFGKKAELELWKQTDKAFSNYGKLLPPIAIKADMKRYNTVSLMDGQLDTIRDCYNQLFDCIKSK